MCCCCGDSVLKDFTLTAVSLAEFKTKVSNLFVDVPGAKYRITLTKWTNKRSISANAQQHLWYGQIAKGKGDCTAINIKNFCKDAIALPLVLNSPIHGDKMSFLLDKLDYYKHSYDSRMKLIQCLEVTSLLSTAESKIYMDNLIFYWNDLGYPIKFKDQ